MDIKGFCVDFDDISFLMEGGGVSEFVDFLKEDMLQLSNKEAGAVIDVSWRPSFSEEGAFFGVFIQGEDWGSPKSYIKTRNVAELKEWILSLVF
jgi:hypothetical protein